MVTELMGGGDVEGVIEGAPEHRVPLEQALRIADQVCAGLEFAHGHGIVHRDLKPGNVWLTVGPSTSSGHGSGQATAKIGDFGLAVAVDRSRLTREGMMVGTVSYMPPEQAMGGEVTPRSDLYSLGAMLYELVTGRPPFVGDDSVAIIGQHLNTPPVSPTWHRPECPPGLEALILRLLEKDSSRWPASAAEVRTALASIDLSQQSVQSAQSADAAAGGGVASATDNPLYRRTFVGRETELRQLQGAFDAALSGQGGLVMVVGEPGIGKTALCEQLATYAAMRGGEALVGHCYEEGSLSLPYLPFVEALRTYVLAREPEDLRRELGSAATDVARIVSEVRDKVQVEPRQSGDPEDDRWRLYHGVTGFLRNASGVQPLMVVLEDLHWADRGTLDFLVHLSRNLSGARLLVVGTYRDVEVDGAHPLSPTLSELRRGSAFGRVPLRGLTPDEVHRMLNALQGQEIRWGFAEAVHRQTEGNPLFIQEVLRYLVEEGLITRQEGRWEARWRRTGEAPPELSIPEGLRDVVGKRLSRLSQECNRLLAIAAVIGREFRLDVLERVAGQEEEALTGILEEAAHAAVIEQRGLVGGALTFRFSHAFFRQTLYEELFSMRRIRLHQSVARALEQVHGRRLEEHAAELAEHFAQSTETEDAAKALKYGELAANRAMAVYDYGEAVRHVERCLQVQEVLDPSAGSGQGPDDKATRCDLLLAPEALALAEALGNRAGQACQLACRALTRSAPGLAWSTPAYRQWAERADRYAAPATAGRVWADLFLARAREGAGRFAEASKHGALGLEQARRLDDKDLLWYAASQNMDFMAAPQRETGKLRLAQEFAGMPRDGVSARTLNLFFSYCANAFLSWGERAGAEGLWRELDELDELAARTRHPGVLGAFDRGQGRAGHPGRATGDRRGRGTRVAVSVGRDWQARLWAGTRFHRAGAAASGPRGRWKCPFLREAQALLGQLLGRGDVASREGALPTMMLTGLLETAVLVEERGAAEQLARALGGVASLLAVSQGGPTCIARHLGAAAALLGNREQARAYYQRAVEVCAKVRFRPEIALTLPSPPGRGEGEGRAEALRREAQEHLDFAIAEFREMRMQPSLERALRHKELLTA